MLVFVDESGDSGMKGKDGSSAFFVINAVLFEENESAEECDRAINKMRAASKFRSKIMGVARDRESTEGHTRCWSEA
jgi:hypothetical protein